MTGATERVERSGDYTGVPVELLAIGCPLGLADAFANALRNQGQAAHVKSAETVEALDQQLAAGDCDLVVINAQSQTPPLIQSVSKVRANNPSARILLVARHPAELRATTVELGLQDLIDINDVDHLALAIRREHQTRLLHLENARLRHQLEEAEERSNQLVQSSRDAIAYIHEGMYLSTNQAYLDLFGIDSAEDIDGLTIMDMIDAESRGDFKAALRQVGETGAHTEEFHCVSSDGNTFRARMTFSPASIEGEYCTQVMIRDQSQSLALQRRIEELTSRDAQTGFFNRQSFMERLEALMGTHPVSAHSHALVQLSITNHQDLREECGFGCAEEILTEVASVLAATATGAHTIARFGDHDFMILCDQSEPALEIAERCLHNLRGHAFKSIDQSLLKPVYSIGVARADSGAISAHELVNRSCRATAIARTEGENRVIFFNDQIPGDTGHLAAADADIVRLIDNALASDGFRLKYQPIVSLQGDTRENYSVYLRLLDDKAREIVPDVFLSPARDANRLAEIDRWVVRNAIRELASHRRDGKKIVFFIILSRAGIEDDSMLLWICDCLREFRAKGSWLTFQFRESDLRNSLKPARELIAGLHRINCRIAINQFSNDDTIDPLLRHLEVDVVKLSPELVRDLADDTTQQANLKQVNGRLQSAGYKTIATGVEDASSLAVLWSVGVNYIQGYYLQEPSTTIAFDDAAMA